MADSKDDQSTGVGKYDEHRPEIESMIDRSYSDNEIWLKIVKKDPSISQVLLADLIRDIRKNKD